MRARSATRSTLGWLFGLSVSILFLALWGRAVVVDTDSLSESLSPLGRSGVVVDMVSNWMSDEMVDSGADPEMVEPAVDYFFDTSDVGVVVEQLTGEVVYAAASSDPAGSSIDMAALVGPAIPDLTVGLNELGYSVAEAEVSAVVGQFDPLVIRPPGSPAIIGPNSPTAARLGTAALLAFIVLVGAGISYVSLSEDRLQAVRDLTTRVALGGLSFAVFLRLGAWVLDPDGGRAPVQESLSALAGSKWAVPLQVALVSGAVAAGGYLFRRGRRQPGIDGGRFDDTEERPMSLTGSF